MGAVLNTAAGAGKTSLAKLQLNGHEGHSLSLIAANRRPRKAAAAADAAEDGSSSSSSGQQRLRFLGVQAPGSSSSTSTGSDAAAGTVLGVAGESWGVAVTGCTSSACKQACRFIVQQSGTHGLHPCLPACVV
jgi:hypothetical protein